MLCNKFGEFFTDKVNKIRDSIIACNEETNDNRYSCDNVLYSNVVIQNDLVCFKKLDQNEVHRIIMDCANKTCTLDCLPTWLLKDNIDVVLPVITDIVNTSLTTGVFPQAMKQAIVTPILKKINSDWNDLKNYRPVSNIGFVGKIIEKAAIIQVNEHMQANDLDDLFQSAYKNKHSTETALLMVKNDIE